MGTDTVTGVLVAAFVGAFFVAWLGTGVLIPWLGRLGMVDRPNERSSHTKPTPRGGGIVPVAVASLAWVTLGGAAVAPVVAGAVLLAVVGWLDDRKPLPLLPRLAAQAVAVALGLAALPPWPDALVAPWFDRVLVGLIWLWWLNAFNFMDGIDGLAAGGAACFAAGAALAGPAPLALALAGAALGFLRWNWPPAKVFLGDAGSVPLGYLAGFLLLATAAAGAWPMAVIVPLAFLADATTTLALRIVRGEPFWRAHREHAYQIAVRHGRSHLRVTGRVLLLNLWLVALAALSLMGGGWTALALAAAVVSVAATLWYFRAPRRHDL